MEVKTQDTLQPKGRVSCVSAMKKEIKISPVTRLEGHAKIHIFLNEEGNVEDAYFQVVELRGFEKFCQGRPAEEMTRIAPRICGVCPNPHHMAAGKAVDMLFGVEATETAKKLRELSLCAHYLHSHIAHFYALAGPDFIVGLNAQPSKRNIFGVIDAVGKEAGSKVIRARAYAQRIQEIVGGRATHPINNLPGGLAKPITYDEQKEITAMSAHLLDFSKFTLKFFEDTVLKNKEYLELIKGDIYKTKTHYMGTVDKNNKVAFYEGEIKVVDPDGKTYARFHGKNYLKHIAEHVEPWTYLKFPYLKDRGWHGLVEGTHSGIYRVAPLSRFNVAEGMATPNADEAYQRMYDLLGEKPFHGTLAMNYARVVEIMYAAERIHELITDPSITDEDVRNIPTDVVGEGIGHVEAPRGTLIHHYISDDEGILTKINIVVATGHNNAAICMSVKKAAEKLIRNHRIDEGLLNMVEMAFRAYDPCFACATHSLPGHMPMEVIIYDSNKKIIKTLTRYE